MGQFKNEGEAAAALAEECAEVIQVIGKYYRFSENWDEIPEGKKSSRWEQLEEEMEDLIFQWERLRKERFAMQA